MKRPPDKPPPAQDLQQSNRASPVELVMPEARKASVHAAVRPALSHCLSKAAIEERMEIAAMSGQHLAKPEKSLSQATVKCSHTQPHVKIGILLKMGIGRRPTWHVSLKHSMPQPKAHSPCRGSHMPDCQSNMSEHVQQLGAHTQP